MKRILIAVLAVAIGFVSLVALAALFGTAGYAADGMQLPETLEPYGTGGSPFSDGHESLYGGGGDDLSVASDDQLTGIIGGTLSKEDAIKIRGDIELSCEGQAQIAFDHCISEGAPRCRSRYEMTLYACQCREAAEDQLEACFEGCDQMPNGTFVQRLTRFFCYQNCPDDYSKTVKACPFPVF